MSALRFEDVLPQAGLFLALVRGRIAAPGIPPLADAVAAARARALPRADLVDAIVVRLAALGAPPESVAAAERLRRDGVVAVVAGQQPSMFGGPLLVAAKALAAVALARRIEAGGVPCVPLFWSASEDHDHAEADHARVVGAEGEVVRVAASLPGDGRMLSRVRAADGAEAVRRFGEFLPQGPARDEVRALLASFATDTVGDAFARLVLGLLGRFGLVVVEPDTVRPFAREVVRRELRSPGVLAATIGVTETAVAVRNGFAAPLALRRPELFYVVEDGVRRRAEPSPELLELFERDPWAFSWNVAARPLAQDAALPVAAQVCGPAEYAYASVLGPAHVELGFPAPALVARTGVTIVEPRIRALAAELGVAPADVVRNPSLRGVGDADELGGAGSAFADARRRVEALPEGRSPASRRRRADVLRGLELYEAALRREGEESDAVRRSRARRVLAALRPEGALQERTLSFLPFVSRAGTAILDRVLAAVAEPGAEHVLVETSEA